ncbi:hypothetical protein I4F81_003169 [Pyropia yezoensis]|uniref:Uncharacterized protein n=1 Tax=Pyropia yezoensis TaxID=2788 RepID=A0ACC3BRG1_PYRYE|nr:hypothetical protein I4F81_003169 [Neopyropia yezoensis]
MVVAGEWIRMMSVQRRQHKMAPTLVKQNLTTRGAPPQRLPRIACEDRRRAAGDRQAALYERRLNFEIQKNRLEEAERNPEATRRAAKQSRVATDQAAAHVEQLALTKL